MEITKLKKNEVFVFGSNANGAHAGGAAFTAFKKFGAELGVGEGPTGQCYAIPTLNKNMQKVKLFWLKRSVNRFLKYAKAHPGQTFLVTKIGCGIAGFSEEEIRPLFASVPANVVLPEDWTEKTRKLYKFMHEGLKSDSGNHVWEVGKWYHEDGIRICGKGFHASDTPLQALGYVKGAVLAEVEAKGDYVEEKDKSCWSDMRIVKAYQWRKEDSVALSVYAAELVLENYEKKYPNEKAPRGAIEAAKKWLAEPSKANQSAARSAAEAAAGAARSAAGAAWAAAAEAAAGAAWAAAWSAAESAAEAAWSAAESAESAARSAAWSAAWAAEDYGKAYVALVQKLDDWFVERMKVLPEVKK